MGQEIIPVAEWRPDMPDLATATAVALNVMPITQESYGPLASLMTYSLNQMDGQCIGAISVQANDLTTFLFAGTADNLYTIVQTAGNLLTDEVGNVLLDEAGNPLYDDTYSAGTTGWAVVSQVPGGYSTAISDNWVFVLYDNTIIASNFSSTPQSYELTVSTSFGDLFAGTAWAQSVSYSTLGGQIIANGSRYTLVVAGTSAATGSGPSGTGSGIVDGTCQWNYQAGPPPQARRMCTPKDFLMLGNTYDPVGGLGPQRVWWSAAGDATSFPAPGSDAAITAMSDYNDFEGNFGGIVGMADSLANADVAVFFKRAVWRGIFVGPPDVFDFFPTENVRGCPAPNSIVPLGSIVWFLGEDGFYMFDGANATPIGADKFDKWFWTTVNQSYLYMVIGAPSVPDKAIYWAFPSTASIGGICDTILIYRWDIQRASYAYLGPGALEWLMRALSFGVSLDEFSLIGYTDLDTLPASLDSAIWIGGVLQFGAINGAHQLAYFTGSNLEAQVVTQTKQLTPGRRTFVQSARPLVDLTSGTPTIAFAARTNLYDTETFGAQVAPDVSGECPQRSDGRYHNAQITLPAGAVWTHIVGVDATFVPAGAR